jgi:threonine aldolase
VIFAPKKAGAAELLVTQLKQRGVLCGTVGQNAVRFVTHRDVDRSACQEAARIAIEEIAKLSR